MPGLPVCLSECPYAHVTGMGHLPRTYFLVMLTRQAHPLALACFADDQSCKHQHVEDICSLLCVISGTKICLHIGVCAYRRTRILFCLVEICFCDVPSTPTHAPPRLAHLLIIPIYSLPIDPLCVYFGTYFLNSA